MLVCLRLLPPRPRLRTIWRDPGLLVCVVVVIVTVVHAGFGILATLRGAIQVQWGVIRGNYWMLEVAPIAASSWLTLALCRRWRPVASRSDRAGRIFGLYWIGLWMFFLMSWVL
jgi:hypothetical protein